LTDLVREHRLGHDAIMDQPAMDLLEELFKRPRTARPRR
jgi:hypothetical protein